MKRIKIFNFLIMASFAILILSCVTQRRCNLKFPPSVETVTIIKQHDSIVYKDTTVFIKLPGEHSTDTVVIPCPPPPPTYIPDTAYAETSLAIAKAWWGYPSIRLNLIQKDTTIEKNLKDARKESYYWKSEYEKIKTVPPPVKYIPKVYKWAFWLWIIVILAGIVYLVYKHYKLKISNLLAKYKTGDLLNNILNKLK